MNKENLYAVTGRLILNPVHHCGQLIYPGYLFIANKTACKFCSLFPLTHLSKDKVKKENFIELESYSLLRLLKASAREKKKQRLERENAFKDRHTSEQVSSTFSGYKTELKLPGMLSALLGGEGYFNHSRKRHTHMDHSRDESNS